MRSLIVTHYRSCGDGFKLLLPNPEALTCYGAALQVFPCNLGPCPVDCAWSVCLPGQPVPQHQPGTGSGETRDLGLLLSTSLVSRFIMASKITMVTMDMDSTANRYICNFHDIPNYNIFKISR